MDNTLVILKASEVRELLVGREWDVIETIRIAYETHQHGASSLPHSTFLRFPEDNRNRIIALPAFLGGTFSLSGVKWIASYPGNLELGLERASAVIILNSTRTGRPEAILEGSIISAVRTAASAALAAQYVHTNRNTSTIGFIGCGVINFTIARFLLTVFPNIKTLVLFDIAANHAQNFGQKCQALRDELQVQVELDVTTVLAKAALVSIATTAIEPYIVDLSMCQPGSTLLHISLRDLTADMILAYDNVVDDIDHVCREQTSVHRAELQVQHRSFIRCTLADITSGAMPARADADQITIFSPFGLGILDLAVSKLVLDAARANQIGMTINGFLP
jgi:ornithine cyclodeaminase